MTDPRPILRYLRDCYLSEVGEQSLANFFGTKVEQPLVLAYADLATGDYPIFPVEDADWAARVRKALALHGKEKDLLMGALFVVGQSQTAGRASPVFAPLLLYPVELREGDSDMAVLDFDALAVNAGALRLLATGQDDFSPMLNQLQAAAQGRPLDFALVSELRQILAALFPQLDASQLLLYPSLMDKAELERVRRASPQAWAILPALAMGLVRKSAGKLGVLNELGELAEAHDFSRPLLELFELAPALRLPSPDRSPARVPAVLNQAQERVIEAARAHALSLVVGPPGTGKSYTIAALAIDALARGQTVLVVAGSNQAVDVVEGKIRDHFGIQDVAVRAGSKGEYKKALVRRLADLLGGMGPRPTESGTARRVAKELNALDKEAAQLEKRLERHAREEAGRGAWLASPATWWDRVRRRWLASRIERGHPMPADMERYLELLDLRAKLRARQLRLAFEQRLFLALERQRPALAQLLAALKARSASAKHRLFEATDLRQAQNAFPIWLVSTDELAGALPLRRELFDLAILDEATQCDMASALPVFQRAARVVVAGDPQQLRHVSFVANARMDFLARKAGLPEALARRLNFREKSLLDRVLEALPAQSQVVFLDEHYRSLPAIIEFSNRHFYQRRLRLMTSTPQTRRVEALVLWPTAGQRLPDGTNPAEAERLVAAALELVEQERRLEPGLCQSIGLLSPFRAQADLLLRMVSERLSLDDLRRHRVLVGTAHAFQGEERDLVFLSMAIDAQSHHSALRHAQRPEVFNVSLTRARARLFVAHSLAAADLPAGALLAQLLRFPQVLRAELEREAAPRGHERFLAEVMDFLRERGHEDLWPMHALAGLEIDLLVGLERGSLAIDLVGCPGQGQDAFPLERYRMLHRVGLRVLPLPYSLWLLVPELARQQLLAALSAPPKP